MSRYSFPWLTSKIMAQQGGMMEIYIRRPFVAACCANGSSGKGLVHFPSNNISLRLDPEETPPGVLFSHLELSPWSKYFSTRHQIALSPPSNLKATYYQQIEKRKCSIVEVKAFELLLLMVSLRSWRVILVQELYHARVVLICLVQVAMSVCWWCKIEISALSKKKLCKRKLYICNHAITRFER